jgi:hypothetical protein
VSHFKLVQLQQHNQDQFRFLKSTVYFHLKCMGSHSQPSLLLFTSRALDTLSPFHLVCVRNFHIRVCCNHCHDIEIKGSRFKSSCLVDKVTNSMIGRSRLYRPSGPVHGQFTNTRNGTLYSDDTLKSEVIVKIRNYPQENVQIQLSSCLSV